MPDSVTREQGARVVVRWMESNPDRLHEPLALLAIEALRAAWP
jgi:Rap1a immunity proteins